MNARQSLYFLLTIVMINGIVGGRYLVLERPEPLLSIALFGFLFSFVPFLWYCRDGDARGYERSRWLSIGVVALAPLAIPYYLVRSRPDGQKGRAVFRFVGYVLLLVLAMMIGAVLGALLP